MACSPSAEARELAVPLDSCNSAIWSEPLEEDELERLTSSMSLSSADEQRRDAWAEWSAARRRERRATERRQQQQQEARSREEAEARARRQALREEKLGAWLARKAREAAERRATERLQQQLAELAAARRRRDPRLVEEWRARKEEEARARRRAERQEQKRREEADKRRKEEAQRAYEEWLRRSKGRPRPMSVKLGSAVRRSASWNTKAWVSNLEP